MRPDATAQATVDLGTAADFGVLAGSGITVAGPASSTTISGDIGTFPITSITGLGNLVLNGVNHGGDSVTQTAKADLLIAYNSAASRTPTVIYAPASDLAGLTLVSGVYKNPTSFDLNGTLTLDAQGNPNAIWIFQAGSTLTTAVASSVSLINGAQACHIFWQVGSSATLFANTDFAGSILAFASITLDNGATVDGRVLALNGAVTLDNNVITVTYCDTIINGTVSITVPTTVNSLDFGGCSSLLLTSDLTVLSGIFNVPSGSAMITGGNIIVPGDFTKIGAGSLVINSLLQVAGNANIEQGSLFVNGTLQANQINVSDNAVLGGTGQIIGNVVNAGTVTPGSNPPTVCTIVPGNNSPGILFVNGNYTQTNTGTLQIDIASPGNFDQLIVAGTANIAGTLDVRNIGGNTLSYGQQVPFLQAGNIVGTFDQILMPDSDLFRGRFVNAGTVGILLVAPTSYTLVATNPNQTNVARALDHWIGTETGDIGVVTLALDMLTADQYSAAFDQIMPGFYASLTDISINQAFAQTQMLNQRMSSVRMGQRGFQVIDMPSQPLVYDKDGKSVADSKSVVDSKETTSYTDLTISTHWDAWVLGTGAFSRSTNISQVPSYRNDAGGVLFGADYRWSENFVTGLYSGYQYSYAKYDGGSSTRGNSALFGTYASYSQGGYYVDAIVGGAYTGYQSRRSIRFGTIDRTARANPNGHQFTAALNLGKDWTIGHFTMGPIIGAQYTFASIGAFSENGADSLNLGVAQQNANSLCSTLGGRVAYSWNINKNFALIPEVRMFWQHEFLNDSHNIGAALDGGGGPGFDFRTNDPSRDSVFAGVGVTAQIGNAWTASVFYYANFGNPTYASNMVSAGLNFAF